MKRPMKRTGVIIAYMVLAACGRSNSDQATSTVTDLSNGVFIVNQGAYLPSPTGTPAGGISFLSRPSSQVTVNLYGSANTGRNLGDNVAHMARIGSRCYVSLAGSNRIEITDSRLFQSLGTIGNLNVPTFCLPLDSTKAYVTEYNSLTSGTGGSVAVVSLTNRTILGRITTGPFPRKLVRIGNNVYVQYGTNSTTPGQNVLTVINTLTDQAVNNLATPLVGAVDMIDGGNNTLWLALQGSPNRVVRVNVTSGAIDLSIPVQGTFALRINLLALNDTGTILYVATSAGVQAITLATQQVQTISTRSFFAIGFDPLGRLLYCGTDLGAATPGSILRYTPANALQDTQQVGARPCAFVF